MPNETPIFALNALIMTYDDFYLIQDDIVGGSHEIEEFVKSNADWVHDDVLKGYTMARVVLPYPPYDPDVGEQQYGVVPRLNL